VALAAALVPAAAFAAPESVRAVVIFLAADRNGDGAIDRDEAYGFREVIFDAIDTNKDNRVSPQEVGVLVVPGKDNADPKEQEKIAKRREEILTKLGLAKPEGVPKDEYLDRSLALFEEADADKSGTVSPEEFAVIVEAYGVLLPK
jgi:Ca2+-binding EF-hand superfamily protein